MKQQVLDMFEAILQSSDDIECIEQDNIPLDLQNELQYNMFLTTQLSGA